LKKIKLYTDGACSGNPGPGGYGLILDYKGKRKEISEGYSHTTNNRMELMAIIRGLSELKEPCYVDIYTDSAYVCNGIEKGWAKKWQSHGWRKGPKLREKALNSDLWVKLLELSEKHTVKIHHIPGHKGHPENERCDSLAVLASKGSNLNLDTKNTPGT